MSYIYLRASILCLQTMTTFVLLQTCPKGSGDDSKAVPGDFSSQSYEDLLATAVLNKVRLAGDLCWPCVGTSLRDLLGGLDF